MSIVTVSAVDCPLWLPATSVDWAVMLCTPSVSVLVVMVAMPVLPTTPLPIGAPPSNSVMVLPTSPPLVNVGVATFVKLSVLETP